MGQILKHMKWIIPLWLCLCNREISSILPDFVKRETRFSDASAVSARSRSIIDFLINVLTPTPRASSLSHETVKCWWSHEVTLIYNEPLRCRWPTQNGHDDVIFEDLNGAARDKVERSEHVSTVDQRVSWGRVGGLEPHGQGAQAALGGSTKRLAALQEVLVEVEADIRLQALWETLQDLRGKHGSKQTWWRLDVMQKKCVFVQSFTVCVEFRVI